MATTTWSLVSLHIHNNHEFMKIPTSTYMSSVMHMSKWILWGPQANPRNSDSKRVCPHHAIIFHCQNPLPKSSSVWFMNICYPPPPPDRFKNVNTLPPTGTWIQHTHICIHADSCAYLIIVYTCTLTCRQTIIEWCLKMSKEGSNIAYIYIWEKKCCIAAIFFKDTPLTASSSASHVNIPPPPNRL